MANIRVLLLGVGAMGSEIARILSGREDVEIVGAIDIDAAKVGRRLSCLAHLDRDNGVVVTPELRTAIREAAPDVIVMTTTAFAKEATSTLSDLLSDGRAVVSIIQEFVYPFGQNNVLADELDTVAKKSGGRFVAVGVNPGFAMDLIPACASVACARVDRVNITRDVDFSPYGPDEMVHIGAGLSESEFRSKAESGEIGHIGLLETTHLVNAYLGLGATRFEQIKEPLIASSTRSTKFIDVAPGFACGFLQKVTAYKDNEVVIEAQMRGVLAPNAEEDGFELGDRTKIFGEPDVEISMPGEICSKGGVATAAVAVNTIPRLLAAEPGLHRYTDLAFPHLWTN